MIYDKYTFIVDLFVPHHYEILKCQCNE